MRFSAFVLLLLICLQGYSQNLDLEEGYYPIVETGQSNSRQMFLRGDSTLVYHIAEKPIVTRSQLILTEADTVTGKLYFYYDKEGTRSLLEFTTTHVGDQIGFVSIGALLKIITVEEIVDNGIIELMANKLRKADRKSGRIEEHRQ
jgi:hypothetical protein